MSEDANHQTRRRQTQEYQEDFPPLPSTWRAPRRGYRSRLHLPAGNLRRPPSVGPSRRGVPPPPPPERRYGRVFGDHSTSSSPSGWELNRSLDTLEEANTHLRALLDLTSSTHLPLPPAMSSTVRHHDNADDGRRVKRRKLDSDRLTPAFKGLRYGKYGQVEPGQLTLEITSCDGGIYSNASLYAAENILKDDQSVYCTKGNRCNIVLKHQGGAAFSLKELVIKAPGSNYSSPVREGMVFVAMNSDELLSRTAQFQIPYVHPRYHSTYARGGGTRSNSAEYPRIPPFVDPYDVTVAENRPVISIRHNEDGSTVTHHHRRARRFYETSPDEDDDARPLAEMPSEFKSTMPAFRITIECSDDEDENEPPQPTRRPPPNRIGALPFESDSDEDGDPFDYLQDFGDDDPGALRAPTLSVVRNGGSGAPQHAEGGAGRAVAGGALMTPHAKFFIEKDKSKCTLRFDPPVSGRFILLKMWSTQHDPNSNIDIQGVVARGFAGPRFFPAVQVR